MSNSKKTLSFKEKQMRIKLAKAMAGSSINIPGTLEDMYLKSQIDVDKELLKKLEALKKEGL